LVFPPAALSILRTLLIFASYLTAIILETLLMSSQKDLMTLFYETEIMNEVCTYNYDVIDLFNVRKHHLIQVLVVVHFIVNQHQNVY
jgi:hypothetical protein